MIKFSEVELGENVLCIQKNSTNIMQYTKLRYSRNKLAVFLYIKMHIVGQPEQIFSKWELVKDLDAKYEVIDYVE